MTKCVVCAREIPEGMDLHAGCVAAYIKLEAAAKLYAALSAIVEGVSFTARAGGYDRDTRRELGVYEFVCSDVEGNRIDAAQAALKIARMAELGS